MTDENFCSSCVYKHDCKTVSERLGRYEGPSVVPEVLIAFLLPIVVFIAVFVATEVFFARILTNHGVRTLAGAVTAAGVGLLCVVIITVFRRFAGRNNNTRRRSLQGEPRSTRQAD